MLRQPRMTTTTATVIDTKTANGAATWTGSVSARRGTATSASPNPRAERMKVAKKRTASTRKVVPAAAGITLPASRAKDALARIDPGVNERADDAERGGDEEWNVPAEVFDQVCEQRGRNSAADVAAHVHDGSGAAGKVAADIEWNGPGDADRQFQTAEGQATERDAEFRIVSECCRKNSDGCDNEANDANDAAGVCNVAGAAQDAIGEPAAGQIGKSAREQRKAGVEAHLLKIEAAVAVQVGWEPIEVNRERVLIAEIHQGKLPDGVAGENAAPGNTNPNLGSGPAGSGLNQLKLGGVDATMLLGRIAVIEEPEGRPNQPEPRERQKGRTPAVKHDHPNNQRRRDGCA